MYLVRIEARSKGLLSVHSQHHTFKTYEAARTYVLGIEKRNPDCRCRIFKEIDRKNREEIDNVKL